MGITHPSVEGQSRVLRTAYRKANLDPNKTAYAECHGTGTPASLVISTPIRLLANLCRSEILSKSALSQAP